MKLLILSALVAAAMAQSSPTPKPTASPTRDQSHPLEPGQSYCNTNALFEYKNGAQSYDAADNTWNDISTKYPQGKGTMKCEYWEQCETVTGNEENTGIRDMSFCMKKGNTACHRYGTGGDEGTIVYTNPEGCTPSQTCCDGNCCELFSEACMDQTKGSFNYGWSEAMWQAKVCQKPQGKGPCDSWSTGYVNYQYDAYQASRNDWKDERGTEFKNQPRMCMPSTTYMNPTAGLKVIYLPILGILVGAFCAKMAMEGEAASKMVCVAMIVISMFLQFSYYTPYAFVTMAVATATAKSGGRGWAGNWVCFFQIFIFWYFMGGESFIFRSPNSIKIGGSGNFIADFGKETTSLTAGCSSYFNFFGVASGNRKWWSSTDRDAWGYCSVEWVGFQLFLAVTNFVLFLVITVMTIVDRLSNAGGGKGDEGAIITTAI